MTHRFLGALLVATSTLAGSAYAQSAYPTRPVTIVVPAAAGGPTDAVARVVARSFQRQSGQAFVIENVAGGGSTIGTARVAAAKPDGYTLLWGGSSGMVVAPHLVSQVKYDPQTSFAHAGIVAYTPYAVMVKEPSEYKTFEQLVAYGKANPGKLNVASTGAGTQGHLTIEMLLDEAGIKALHVPFKGGPPAMTALIGGEVDVLVDAPGPAMAMIEAKRVRVLAVTSQKRLPNLPDTRTIQEAGVRGFESEAWWALQAPRGTPDPIMQSLQKMLGLALADPETTEALKRNSLVPGRANASDVAETIRRESPRWARVIKQHNITMD